MAYLTDALTEMSRVRVGTRRYTISLFLAEGTTGYHGGRSASDRSRVEPVYGSVPTLHSLKAARLQNREDLLLLGAEFYSLPQEEESG